MDDEEEIDLYGFFGVGYNYVTYVVSSNDPLATNEKIKPFPIKIKPGIGIRYYIFNGFAINAEISLSSSLIAGGVSYSWKSKKSNYFEKD